jgi:dipeptidyl aminopeptidase/acylaminoacyl peptidase
MSTSRLVRCACAAVAPFAVGLTVATASAQTPAAVPQKRTVPPAEYGRFEQLGAMRLAPDGRTLAYQVSRVDETRELRVRPLDRDSVRVVPWGESPAFSADSRWLLLGVGVSPAEQRRLERERKPVRLGAGLLDVRGDGAARVRTFETVRARAFDATGRFLVLHGYPPDPPAGAAPTGRGADLRVLDLQAGTELTLGNVAEFAWSSAGSRLAVTVATGSAAGNGVQVYDARSARLQSLDASGSTYRQLAWRRGGADLAVLRSVRPVSTQAAPAPAGGGAAPAGGPVGSGAPAPRPAPSAGRFVLLAWRGLDGARPERLQLDSVGTGLADTLAIAEHFRPRWSDDGRRLAVGLRPVTRDADARAGAVPDTTRRLVDSTGLRRDSTPSRPDAPRTPADSARVLPRGTAARADSAPAEELPGVQLWHTRDVRIVPQQQVQARERAERTLLAVWEPSTRRVVQVGTRLLEESTLLDGWRYATERDASPYPWGTMFGRPYHDVWAVDLTTGVRRQVLDSVRYSWPSGGGRYLLAFDGRDYWTHDLGTGVRRNVTRGIAASFADTASDTPTDLLPPHGVGGWEDGDRAVLLYDRYDVWRVSPDGSGATRLTRGAEDSTEHRLVRLDTARRTLDPRAPLYLSLHGEWSERRGYARVRPGARVAERLVYEDAFVGGLARADSAPVLAYRAERRDDAPDVFTAGPDLRAPRQVTALNPFQRDYATSRTELVEYRSETGRRLQGVLLYPAGYDSTRRYPMLVFAYEIQSSEAHVYEPPDEQRYYGFAAWTQRGYFVLLPDIVFRARDPGVSLLETLRPAVAGVVARGLVDPKRVGFVGHSWGGYHAAYVATHSDLFAAAVAGAPLTDFVSFMGQIHWSPGAAELDHWETGQARMQVPYWEDPEAHHRNSPIHNVHNMRTPLLMAFGNEDGVVDWDQGTEFYNFARRAGRQMVLVVYEGEGHGFRRKPNRIDYHRRILEWFGHYLNGDPAPAWITSGVPLDDMEREKRRVQRAVTPMVVPAITPGGATQAVPAP